MSRIAHRADSYRRILKLPDRDGASESPQALRDAIYHSLRDALMTGILQPGEKFSIRMLAAVFDTSPMPVRDALGRLAAERAMVLLPNRAASVPVMTRSRFQEILQIRLAVEPMLAREATYRTSLPLIRELELSNQRMREAAAREDTAAFLSANHAFHFALYEAAGSEVAMPIVGGLWLQVGPFINWVCTKVGTRTAQDNHLAILKALKRRDSAAVGEAVSADIGDAAVEILSRFDVFEPAEQSAIA